MSWLTALGIDYIEPATLFPIFGRWSRIEKWKALAFLVVICGATLVAGLAHAQRYTCAEKHCSDMRDCGEVWYGLTVCGNRKLDGNNDGIACNSLCRNRQGHALPNTRLKIVSTCLV